MTSETILLVEGPDDAHVLANLLLRHSVRAYATDSRRSTPEREGIPVIAKGGWPKLRDEIRQELQRSGLRYLGIVVDADSPARPRWQSICDILGSEGYRVPELPDHAGTVIESGDLVRVGVWLMPNNTLDGVLEDFVAQLIPSGDALWAMGCACVDSIPAALLRFRETDRPKAKIHTWLAWQADPGRPMGEAITKMLDSDARLAKSFVTWVRRLMA